MKIMILTTGKPIKSQGGPSKFTPLLFEWLYKYDNTNEYIGFFGFSLYKKPDDIKYSDNELAKKGMLRNIKNLIGKIDIVRFLYMEAKKYYHKNLINNAIKTNKVDIIHSHDFYATSLLSENIGCPIIFTNHFKGSLYEEYIKYNKQFSNSFFEIYFKNIERKAINRATKITFPSKMAKKLLINDFPDLANIIESKAEIIYTGIDKLPINQKIFQKKEKYIILNIANHIPSKGLKDTLNIIKTLYNFRKDFEFINCGAFGPETNYLLNFVKSNNMENYVKFLGILDNKDILELYKKADIFLITQKIAVFDLVVLEAMSIGLPVVATNILSNIEALGDSYPFLIDINKNDYKAAANLINVLLDKKDLYNDISNYLSVRFKNNFSKENMLESYKKLYENVIKKY